MSCSCGGGCGGSGPGAYHGPTSWRSTQVEPGAGCKGAQLGQPGRAPGRASSGHGFPWWIWILVALVGYRLLKGGA